MNKIRVVVIVAIAVVLLLGTIVVAYARGNPYPSVYPPASRVQGLTHGEWLAQWWKYALELPGAQNPLAGVEGCVFQRVGNVGLVLANSTLSEPIPCEVPAGMKLYIEVLGAECSTLEEPPFYGGNEAELRECALAFTPSDMKATIDGVAVPHLNSYIFLSPMYNFAVPDDNVLGLPSAASGQSIGSGAYLMIAPLSPGQHTIHVKGTYTSLDYTADKTFNLEVIR